MLSLSSHPEIAPHLAANCPGNKALGIPPRNPSTVFPSKNAVFSISEHIDEPDTSVTTPDTSVLAVFPAQPAHVAAKAGPCRPAGMNFS